MLSIIGIICISWQFSPSNSAYFYPVSSFSIFQKFSLNINFFSQKLPSLTFGIFLLLTFGLRTTENYAERFCFLTLEIRIPSKQNQRNLLAFLKRRGSSWYKFLFAQNPSSQIFGIFYFFTLISTTNGFCCSIHFRNYLAKVANNNLYK